MGEDPPAAKRARSGDARDGSAELAADALLGARPSAKALVKAMEVAVAFSPDDYGAYASSLGGALADGELSRGFAYSGSYAGRNVEKIYAKAAAAGSPCCLHGAVQACLERQLRHVLVCSGFYVLHTRGGDAARAPGLAPGSCETDGPLGALALVRAFAARGVKVSLYCEPHNGPVLRAGYDAMLAHFDRTDAAFAAQLRRCSRCLPDAKDGSGDEPSEDFKALYAQTFKEESVPKSNQLRCRMLRCCSELAAAAASAWGDERPGDFDCLFALERLGAPYRNIRGRDIAEHTEPIDCLWPLAQPPSKGELAESMSAYCREHGLAAEATAALRRVAGVAEGALTLGIGDGGNEVGMGKLVVLDGVSDLSPGGEFVALSINGTYRTCDHALVATVSNWGGSAFEAAAHVLRRPEVDYFATMAASGKSIADLEDELLRVIMAEPWVSVDGKYNDRPHSVDGMSFEPYHRELYDYLWSLAVKQS